MVKRLKMNTELIINKLENFVEDKNYLLLVTNWLNQLTKYNPRDCIVEVIENEVTITWNRGHYYFNNEICENGYVNWFFRDRLNDKISEGLEFISNNFHSSEFQRLRQPRVNRINKQSLEINESFLYFKNK